MESITKNILSEENILPFKTNNTSGEYYIEPYEYSSRIINCIISKEFLMIFITITMNYNKSRQTQRIFSIENRK